MSEIIFIKWTNWNEPFFLNRELAQTMQKYAVFVSSFKHVVIAKISSA